MNNKALQFEGSQDKVYAPDLISTLERYLSKISVLSLDCFDTILWRKTAEPFDIFFDLQNKPCFQSLGFSGLLRMNSESIARQMKLLKERTSEVKLVDIYREFNASLNQEQLNALTEEELSIEIENGFAFPPIVELIRAAYKHRIKIIIVSDTYFTEQQLRRLLENALPQDVLQAIDAIFCSSEYKRSKVNGLFENVLQSLQLKPSSILHIGDNFTADYIAARTLQLNAFHFVHHDERIADIIRLQTISASIADSSIRYTKGLFSPFRGVLSNTHFPSDKPEKLIGYASLGPMMYAFSHFICDEIEQMRLIGKKVKVAFLMRDAHLPSLTCEALAGQSMGSRVQISRFASLAASFYTEEDVDRYIATIGRTDRYYDLARQLLLSEKVVDPLIKIALRSSDPESEFIKQLHRKEILRIIFNKSAEYRARLKRYLDNELDLKAGDTLVFVDLGYSGTAQRLLSPMFQENGIEVVGRYLMAVRTPGWQENRRGLLDPSWCDDRMLKMLIVHISLLEQLCTSNGKIVIDYDQQGKVIYTDVTLSKQQYSNLTSIQSECINFIRDAKEFFQSHQISVSLSMLQQSVLTELSRMIFLATEPELQYIKHFQFDVDMGTKDLYKLFDPEKGLAGLKRRGLFYMDKTSMTLRTNYPAELRTAGFELAITSMVQNRFALDIKPKDMLPRQELLEVVLMQGGEVGKAILEATATHDGYFSIWAPLGTGVVVLLGKKYQWIQIESAELIKTEAFIHQVESQGIVDAFSCLTFEYMTDKTGGLFECISESSALVVRPERMKLDHDDYVFRLVFRPIVNKSATHFRQKDGINAAFSISV